MLSPTPKPCQPERELCNNAKMFQPEFRKHNIEFKCGIDDPYKELGVGRSMADLSRIGQVLINFVSNAIKFTSRKAGSRKISVRISASLERARLLPSRSCLL